MKPKKEEEEDKREKSRSPHDWDNYTDMTEFRQV